MKHKILLMAAMLFCVTCTFTSCGQNAENTNATGTLQGHEWVDLGLPSGVKWASCNVGANAPEEYGDYFAWGETATKQEYTTETSKLYNFASTLMMNADHNIISCNALTKNYDAATQNWGSEWRIPSETELEELNMHCTSEWVTQNGVYGRKVTSRTNGNSIFLPAAGYREGSELKETGSNGYYWSASPNRGSAEYAYTIYLDETNFYPSSARRDSGFPVRPVTDKTENN